jgi:hypothetical protein
MKKLVTFATAASMLAFIACGPSAEDKAKMDKMRADSAHAADSMKAAQAAQMMKMKQDSMSAKMKADSAAHADSAKAK